MIKIAICDDERELREATAARLREYFAEEALIAPFESGEALLRAVREENCRYQLAVLDIELGERTELRREKHDSDHSVFYIAFLWKHGVWHHQ